MSSTTLPVCPKTGSTSPSLTVHLCLHTAPGNRECAHGDRCAACAMRTRAGRTLPDDDGAADPPVDGWDVIRIRKLLL